MANALTAVRILCGPLLLVFPTFSKTYYMFYLLGGFTDAIDGTVARRTGTESAFGAKLDTAADIVFVLSAIISVVRALVIPVWLLVWIGAILFIKAVSIVVGYKKYHRFVAVHSALNKVCGVMVFIVPLFIGGYYAWQARALGIIAVCVLCTAAAIHEYCSIQRGNISE